MHIATSDQVVCFDVDDTLIMWETSKPVTPGYVRDIKDPLIIIGKRPHQRLIKPHRRHVEKIKEAKARGHYVVVWSQGGYEHALQVVVALELSDYVDLVMSKPKWVYDDISPKEWMPHPFYFVDAES